MSDNAHYVNKVMSALLAVSHLHPRLHDTEHVPPLTNSYGGDDSLPFEESSVRSDILYELMAYGRNGNAYSAYFSAADLAAIAAGFTLTPAAPESIDAVLTPPEFESHAAEACS